MNSHCPFYRRFALYSELDGQWCSRTRFYGAAALTNLAFSRFFLLTRCRSRPLHHFLFTLGKSLEAANLKSADEMALRTEQAAFLDLDLVRREQRLVQLHVEANYRHRLAIWEGVRHALDRLLNQTWVAPVLIGCLGCNRGFHGVLRSVRNDLGGKLNFADERHRVRIGLGLIEYIRAQGMPA